MIVVAGHLCLDVTPALDRAASLAPGTLVEVGPASFTPGGAVGNVGTALTRLGARVRLVARVGEDPFAAVLQGVLERHAEGAETALLPAEAATSYTVVVSAVGQDRAFLHHPGANHAFAAVDLERTAGEAELLHLGYPPLLGSLYRDGGRGLAESLRRLRAQGTAISLDMTMPDPDGPSGRVDWRAFLELVLPHVDLFAPSWPEIVRMLEPEGAPREPRPEAVATMASRLLERGPAVVALKLGERGFYLRTAESPRLAKAGQTPPPPSWASREAWSPNFRVEAINTTGAGDATIAGLLASWQAGASLEEACTMAAAVGACAVEGADGIGAVPPWDALRARAQAGWERQPFAHPGWRRDDASGTYLGPADGEP